MKKWVIQYLKAFIHNVIVHPAMMIMPAKWGDWMHDINATWAFGLDKFDELDLEK